MLRCPAFFAFSVESNVVNSNTLNSGFWFICPNDVILSALCISECVRTHSKLNASVNTPVDWNTPHRQLYSQRQANSRSKGGEIKVRTIKRCHLRFLHEQIERKVPSRWPPSSGSTEKLNLIEQTSTATIMGVRERHRGAC